MVAAPVEVGTVPLAQVNALLLFWKRAGAAGCWHTYATTPCGSPRAAGPLREVQCLPREVAGLTPRHSPGLEALPG